jgi:hypothetical protein
VKAFLPDLTYCTRCANCKTFFFVAKAKTYVSITEPEYYAIPGANHRIIKNSENVNNKLFDPYTVKTGTDSQLLQKPSVQMY